MTEEQFGMRLAMVSTTDHSAPVGHGARSWFPLSGFELMRILQKAGMMVLIGALSMGAYFVVGNYFVKSVKVVGTSMVPTLGENNRYLLNIWALHNREPQRNDIVVIRDPGDNGLSVKRIIAVGGESVHFKNGKVYVNGHQLDEPYLLPRTRTFTYSTAKEQFITCGSDQFFVLGDNRTVSIDSRSYGPVPRENVLGLIEKK